VVQKKRALGAFSLLNYEGNVIIGGVSAYSEFLGYNGTYDPETYQADWTYSLDGMYTHVEDFSIGGNGILSSENPVLTHDPDPLPATPPGNFWVLFTVKTATVTKAALRGRVEAKFNSVGWSGISESTSSEPGSSRNSEDALIPILQGTRYRWQVPVSHLGSYFKITWDILETPDDWDNTEIPVETRPVRVSVKDLTVEWSGPGTGAQSNPSWFAGDWQVLDPPAKPGTRKIVNIRYLHTKSSPYGQLPDTTGNFISDIPDPPPPDPP
jgi:hypothetical protein